MANEIWRLPYTAQQLQDAVTNQIPRINASKHWERWDVSTSTWDDTGVRAEAKEPVHGTITLAADGWTDNDPIYTQTVQIAGATAQSWIVLCVSDEQLAQLDADECAGINCNNVNGTITVSAIRNPPSVTMTVEYIMFNTTALMGAVGDIALGLPNSPISNVNTIIDDEYIIVQ